MTFRLRGGRPKNKGQGIYWVQRHVADQKAAARSAATAQRQADKQKEKIDAFVGRYERLFLNVKNFFDEQGEIRVGEKDRDRIATAQERWEDLRQAIVDDPGSMTHADLSKFATAGKNLISVFAKAAGMHASWMPSLKQLRVGDKRLDFG